MNLVKRTLTYTSGVLKRYGPSKVKQFLWDKEFSGKHWDFIDDTVGDCVYAYLEKYTENGSVLDLGCGPGNTANELATSAYTTYVGVDISEAALRKARRRTEQNGRGDKNSYACADFVRYVPTQQFDVILFRESMYHVPLGEVKSILDRYSKCLSDRGLFIVRINTSDGGGGQKQRLTAAVGVMETEFDVIEKQQFGEQGPTVIVFRRKCALAKQTKLQAENGMSQLPATR